MLVELLEEFIGKTEMDQTALEDHREAIEEDTLRKRL